MKYDFIQIEHRWQDHWARRHTFKTPNPGDAGFEPGKPKYYVLDMFPYPSGIGLHVGHPLGYIATDIVARYKRMKGFNVLHPMGFDAFGLPAEQFAVEHGVHPRITTEQNIATMLTQLKRLGLSFDWDRKLSTTDPDYYKWTQWIFLHLYNSWFDEEENRARPIKELLAELESGEYDIGPDNELTPVPLDGGMDALGGVTPFNRKWQDLSQEERREFIDDQRLAYLAEVPVNWCPALGTVLANEEVTNEGRSERGNHPVFKRPLKQWMLRITAYCDRLDRDLDLVKWPESVKDMQRNWIGRSEGARVNFEVAADIGDAIKGVIEIFTTRPDTLFGATYMVLAPEHPMVEVATTAAQRAAVKAYQQQAAKKSDMDRQAEAAAGKKTGVFTGGYAINPVNDQKIPIWIADYVMMGYGTGAIMAVPAHDQRDFDFAKQFNLQIVEVVASPEGKSASPSQEEAFVDEGVNINSANAEVSLNGLPTAESKKKIAEWLESKGLGKATETYKLRDWLFSRQRYWGEPFPILHGPDGEIVAVDESDLPVRLPEMENFQPVASDDPDAKPVPPLGRATDSWKHITRDGKRYTREFNTMPQWAGSCWYYLRFLDPRNGGAFVGKEAERYWMVSKKRQEAGGKRQEGDGYHAGGVDLYVGGVEHAVLHLLYARFWHKVLFDLGYVSTPEPFGRLFNQGYIQAFCYRDGRGIAVEATEVEERDGKYFHKGQEVTREQGKMGKSLKNAIAPDDICAEYGCDTLRLYEMYLGPLDQSKIWNTRDIVGVHRFLHRFWRVLVDENSGAFKVTDAPAVDDLKRFTHRTIKRVTDAMESMSFNVAIAALIELVNDLVKRFGSDTINEPGRPVPREVVEPMVLLLSPLAPHMAEEVWRKLGHEDSLAHEPWPACDEALLKEDTIELPVQVNGKLRGYVRVPSGSDDKAVETAALADEKIRAATAGKSVKKVIVVKDRLANVVVG